MQKNRLENILVVILAIVTVVLCVVVILSEFPALSGGLFATPTPEPVAVVVATPTPTPEPTAEPTPEPTPEPVATPYPYLAEAATSSSSLTVIEIIDQLIITDLDVASEQEVDTHTYDSGVSAGLATNPVGGVYLKPANIEDEDQIAQLLSDMQNDVKTKMFFTYNASASGNTNVAVSGNLRDLGFNLNIGDEEDGIMNAVAYDPDNAPGENSILMLDPEDAVNKDVITNIRGTMNYEGAIIANLLNDSNAVEDAVKAVAAGCDILLLSGSDYGDAWDAIYAAFSDGTITEAQLREAVKYVYAAKMEIGILPFSGSSTEDALEAVSTNDVAAEFTENNNPEDGDQEGAAGAGEYIPEE